MLVPSFKSNCWAKKKKFQVTRSKLVGERAKLIYNIYLLDLIVSLFEDTVLIITLARGGYGIHHVSLFDGIDNNVGQRRVWDSLRAFIYIHTRLVSEINNKFYFSF